MNAVASIAHGIDWLNEQIGRHVAWLALFMVLVQFIVVVMRYIYGLGSIALQESIIYMHGVLFLVGSGYTLLHGGHVRVDIFYREASPRSKAWVDLCGALFLLIPVCLAIFWVSFPYVAESINHTEGSKETSGIQAVYLLKTTILIFCVLMIAQGVSMALQSLLVLTGHDQTLMTADTREGI